jgi:ankyrin repeat protein
MEACSESGKAQIVRLLLTYGAQADRRKLDGQSALHLAVIVNDFAAARLLVQARANVNIPDMRGRTPVYYVTSVETARLLVENGARLNTVDKTGRSPYVYVRDWEREHSPRGQNDVSSCLKSPGAQ